MPQDKSLQDETTSPGDEQGAVECVWEEPIGLVVAEWAANGQILLPYGWGFFIGVDPSGDPDEPPTTNDASRSA